MEVSQATESPITITLRRKSSLFRVFATWYMITGTTYLALINVNTMSPRPCRISSKKDFSVPGVPARTGIKRIIITAAIS